jgi:hypothetical protein
MAIDEAVVDLLLLPMLFGEPHPSPVAALSLPHAVARECLVLFGTVARIPQRQRWVSLPTIVSVVLEMMLMMILMTMLARMMPTNVNAGMGVKAAILFLLLLAVVVGLVILTMTMMMMIMMMMMMMMMMSSVSDFSS